MAGMRRILVAFILAGALAAASAADTGSVQFSDGRVEAGEVRLAQDLVLHDGRTQHRLAAARVCELRLEPEREEMAASWRFPEPGKPGKELVGRPYPVRALRASVRLEDGSVLAGHLHTTVVYLETAEGTGKVVVPSKQQGGPDQGLADLVYPVRIVIRPPAGALAPTRLRLPGGDDAEALALLVGDGLVRVEAQRADGAWRLPAGTAPPAVLAARTPAGLVVGWPADDAALRARLAAPLAALVDYLDERRLLAAAPASAPASTEGACLALVLARRTGATTGDAAARPWRLEVWRWRGDPLDPARWLLAARGLLLRGTGTPPAVRIEPAWWPLRAGPDGWEVGDGR